MKYFKTYESFSSIRKLNEIGDSHPFDWKLLDTKKESGSTKYIYEFLAGPSDIYEVEITHINRISDTERIAVKFSVDGSTDIITNSGVALPVFSTVFAIVKEFIVKHPGVKEIGFVPSKAHEFDDRREKIYLYYIKKNFPGSKIRRENVGAGQSSAISIDVVL